MHLLKVAGSGPNCISLKCLEMSVRSLQDWGKHKWEKRGKKNNPKNYTNTDLGFFFFSFKNSIFSSWKSFHGLPSAVIRKNIFPNKPFYKQVNTQHSSAHV